MRIAVCFAVAALGVLPNFAQAEDIKTFSAAEQAGIEAIVKNYLTQKHPEVIMEAAQEMQKRDLATAETKGEEAVAKSKDKIFNNPNSPIVGNAKGDVTVVEFYDYQCGYCKMSEVAIEKLLKEDKNVKFIYKDFPILGPASVDASKASFASMKQDRFMKFHNALMNKKDHVSDELITKTAKEVGLDVEKLKKDMTDPAIQKMIDENLELGSEVGVRGTPMFIINDKIYPGALQFDQLKKAVDEARAAAKKS
jgi:protein-disulfide isomerase